MRGGADLRVREQPEVSLQHLRDCSLAVCDFFRGNWQGNGMVSYGKKGGLFASNIFRFEERNGIFNWNSNNLRTGVSRG